MPPIKSIKILNYYIYETDYFKLCIFPFAIVSHGPKIKSVLKLIKCRLLFVIPIMLYMFILVATFKTLCFYFYFPCKYISQSYLFNSFLGIRLLVNL